MTKFIFTITLFTMFSVSINGQSIDQRQKHFNTDKQHLAIEGYDPVSYFNGKPLKGKIEWSTTNDGITYRFSSVANKNDFIANPKKYQPAYGGWCAYAMSIKGEKVDVDPLTYKITNGRLLLFYNRFFTNTLESWNEQKSPESELLKKGDQSWEKFIGQSNF
ncbi:MAG: YHS domain-containing (seleno)protein [Saprospiraceae bacterium]